MTLRRGSHRRSLYVFDDEQREAALASKAAYEDALAAAGYLPVTTEIIDAPAFYYAEHYYHQQYLAKVPNGYCGLGGTGVSCDIAPLVAYSAA